MNIDVEKVVREYIDKTVHMSLATVEGDQPWVCEVHFAYDKDLNLYFISLPTRRHSQEIAANNKVAGNIIDKYELGQPVVGVYFDGSAEMLEAGEDRKIAVDAIKERLKRADDLESELDSPDGHRIYKIKVKNWYVFGRFGASSGQKHQLAWDGGSK